MKIPLISLCGMFPKGKKIKLREESNRQYEIMGNPKIIYLRQANRPMYILRQTHTFLCSFSFQSLTLDHDYPFLLRLPRSVLPVAMVRQTSRKVIQSFDLKDGAPHTSESSL